MNELLVVAYNFPPCSAPGTYRTLAFVKYLAQEGWRSTVLCAGNFSDPERDDALLAKVPPGTKVVHTTDLNLLAWKDRLLKPWQANRANGAPSSPSSNRPSLVGGARLLKNYLGVRLRIPDECQGWYPHTVMTGGRIIRAGQFDALYSTAPPWTAHLVALRLATRFKIPWIADFRDPWVSNPFAKEIPFTTLRKRYAEAESRVVRSADKIICVLETMRADFLARYPGRSREDVLTIPNGFDPEDYTDLSAEPDGPFTILHAGALYGRRRIDPLLSALKEWRQNDQRNSMLPHVRLLGGTGEDVDDLLHTIERWGLRDCVYAEPHVPHREALRHLSRATVLLLIGFSGPGAEYQMTGKIFEYLAVHRPILAIAPPSCPIGDVLRNTGVRHWIVSPDDRPGLLSALADIARQWEDGKLCEAEPARLEAFNRREHAKQLAHLLEQVSRTRKSQVGPRSE